MEITEVLDRKKGSNKLLIRLFALIDYLIIIYKISVFFYILKDFETARNPFSKEIYSYFLLPREMYCVINLIRLFFRRSKYILSLELLVNFIFTFIYAVYHEYIFLILTIVSLFTLYYPLKKRLDGL
jgi:hypothetical protein